MSISILASALAVQAAGVELNPGDDIRKALDKAAPGDTIALRDGVYCQSLVIARGGTPERPVTLKALHGGGATISGAVPTDQAKLKFELVEGGAAACIRGSSVHSTRQLTGPERDRDPQGLRRELGR